MFSTWIIFVVGGSLFSNVTPVKVEGRITTSAGIVTSETKVLNITCTLNSEDDFASSQSLSITHHGVQLQSEIVDDSTIKTTIQLDVNNSHFICGERKYSCQYNTKPIDETSVIFGELPPKIEQDQFKCISENLEYLHCEFPYVDTCLSDTSYTLLLLEDGGYSSCGLSQSNGMMFYDSRNGGGCAYNPDVETLTFWLRTSNRFGSTESPFRLDHYDIVRPAPVHSLGCFERKVTWKSIKNLSYLGRSFEYHIRSSCPTSEKDTYFSKQFMVFNATLKKLSMCSRNVSVRLRIVPRNSLNLGSGVWSDWRSVEYSRFRTIKLGYKGDDDGRRNYSPLKPVYSSKGKGNHTTFQLYWINSESQRFNVTMGSDSNTIHPTSVHHGSSHGVATFQNMLPKIYNIKFPTYSINIVPQDELHRPRFRRVVNNNGSFEVLWFPVKNQHNLLSYTLLHCHYTVTDFCQDSVVLTSIQPSETSFNIFSKVILNFAISANYRNFSSSLSWRKCVVPPSGTFVGPPQFAISDKSENSLSLRFETPCPDRSYYQTLEVEVRKAAGAEVFRGSFEPFIERVEIPNLVEDTPYELIVGAFNESGHHIGTTRMIAHTAKRVTSITSSIYIYVVILLATILLQQLSLKVKRVIDIDVEVPLGLAEIYEAKIRSVSINCSIAEKYGECTENGQTNIEEDVDYSPDRKLLDSEGNLQKSEDQTNTLSDDYVDVNFLQNAIEVRPIVKHTSSDDYVTVEALFQSKI